MTVYNDTWRAQGQERTARQEDRAGRDLCEDQGQDHSEADV